MSTTDTLLDRFVTRAVEQAKQAEADYRAEAREAMEAGYRPTHCVHGTRMVWSDDRDAICGSCEEGLTLTDLAVTYAQAQVEEYRRRGVAMRDVLNTLAEAGVESDTREAVTRRLLRWIAEADR